MPGSVSWKKCGPEFRQDLFGRPLGYLDAFKMFHVSKGLAILEEEI